MHGKLLFGLVMNYTKQYYTDICNLRQHTKNPSVSAWVLNYIAIDFFENLKTRCLVTT